MSELNKRKTSWDELKDIASLSILQLIYLLKPAQAWGILVAIFAVLSGTFGIGYKLSELVTEVKVVRYETENAGLLERSELIKVASEAKVERYKTENVALRDKIKQFRAIQTKERFLALYLRYLIAKDTYSTEESEENQKSIENAAFYLQSYIKELLDRGEEASEEIDLRGLFLSKGGGKKATVKFGYDGSVWDLPPEFGFAAEE